MYNELIFIHVRATFECPARCDIELLTYLRRHAGCHRNSTRLAAALAENNLASRSKLPEIETGLSILNDVGESAKTVCMICI